MRTVKFRGRSLDSGEWIHGESVLIDHEITDRASVMPDDTTYGLFEEVEYSTLGQFTGLYDREQKPIYEGDILKLGGSDSGICEVRWNADVSAFCIRFNFEREVGLKPLGSWQEVERDIVIIGNIHDNPELLKAGKEE